MQLNNPEITNCAERNDREGVLRCLENNQPIDETRRDGRSALLIACMNGHFDIVKLLVENNANIFLKNNKGSNAILHAAYKNHYEIISYLVSKGVNANECDINGRNALHMACSHGANETILFLLNNNVIKDINAKTNDKKDALLCSIDGNCSATSVLELLANGANVLTQTSEGHNVLMECARQGRTKLFHVLYRYSNINVNIKDYSDNCCIHFACESGNTHIIRSLLHRGAFVKVRNKKGKYPVDIARENDHDECVALLEAICSPPIEPVIENVLLVSKDQGGAVAVVWKNPRPFNYYPTITAIEVQLKQQRLFDQWKTIGTVQMSDSAFKEKLSTVKLPFLQGELTDCESESELDERNEVEMSCLSVSNREETMEMRQELDNLEHMLPRYYILSDLVDSNRYSVRVRLANKYGWGTYSSSSNFCIHDLISEFRIQDFQPIFITRNSLLNQASPPKTSDLKTMKVDESVINGLTEALDKQRNIKSSTVSATEILTRALSEGVDYLNKLLSEDINLSTIRNANGMSLLHAASASTSPHALYLIHEIVNRNLLSVNDRSKNGSIPLHFAIYNSNFEAALFLINNHSDLTAKDSNGITPFLLAVERGNLQLCTCIAETIPREHLYTVDKSGRNALMLAVNASHLHIADYLIDSLSFDPFQKLPEPYGWNLLFFAVNTKSDTVVKYCLAKGISPVEEALDGSTAIEYSHDKGTDQIDALLERYARVPETVEDIDIQSVENQAILTIPLPPLREKHPLFVIHKVEVSYKKNAMLSTSLTESVTVPADSKEVLIYLRNLTPATQYKCKIRCYNQNGPSKWKSGFDFTTKEEEEMTPEPVHTSDLESKAVSSFINTVRYSVTMENREKGSEEEDVIQWIDTMVMDKLETVSEERLQSTRDSSNLPCLHHLLLTAGVHSRQNVLICLEMLLQKKCDLNEAVDALGMTHLTPIDCACMVCNGQFIPILESRGAELHSTEVLNVPSSLFYSLLSLSPAALQRVMASSSQTFQQVSKVQPLLPLLAMIHKYAGVESIADFLIQEGVDVNQSNSEGNTALHMCVIHNNLLLLAHLLQKGVKTELLNAQGKTAYQLAEQSGNGPAVAIFMNTYRTPWPVQWFTLSSYTPATLLLRWTIPHMPVEIPAVDLYEVEITNTNNHTTLCLPAVNTPYCFLDLPACYHMWCTARVRCHNVNGWGEWSVPSSFLPLPASIAEDDYLTWMVCHDCEDGFAALKDSDCFSLEDLAECTVDQIMELNVPYAVKGKLIQVLPIAMEDVKKGNECLAKSSASHFSWFK